jgi:glycosyltransferase involved in cell wall biosynthesis
MKTYPKVSFVVIGRNEEKHLAACVEALMRLNYPQEQKEIIFVDNNSTDRSLEIARQFPIKIIALKQQPATPGLARNAGLHAATGDYVHFVDGDMTVDADWLIHALPVFEDERVAVVVGRLQEVNPQNSLYNRFFDLGWKTAALGEIEAPGGGGLFRAAVLREAGGYDDSLFGAEEIDLGYRLRQKNFKIFRLPDCMAHHDIDMKSFGHFWRRGVRDGYYEMAMITRYFNWSWPLPQDYIWKMNAQLIAFIALIILLIRQPHPALWLLAVDLPAFFVFKKAWYYYRLTGEKKMSWLAAFFNYFNMFPIAWGEWRFLRSWMSRKCKNFVTEMSCTYSAAQSLETS